MFGFSAAAPGCPECERKPETSNTEIQQFTGVYCGLSAVVLLFCCFSFIYYLHRKQNFYSKLSDACQSVSVWSVETVWVFYFKCSLQVLHVGPKIEKFPSQSFFLMTFKMSWPWDTSSDVFQYTNLQSCIFHRWY